MIRKLTWEILGYRGIRKQNTELCLRQESFDFCFYRPDYPFFFSEKDMFLLLLEEVTITNTPSGSKSYLLNLNLF